MSAKGRVATLSLRETITHELEADFETDLQRCVAFSEAEYYARKRSARFVDSTMRLCSPLL